LDVLDVAILLLRIALVAVLYVFVRFVMRGALRSLLTPPGSRGSVVSRGSATLTLVVVDSSGAAQLAAGSRLEVSSGTIIGRAPPADVIVADKAVSAQHARFEFADGLWRVSDLGSTNGTRLNDRPVVAPSRLRRGDQLELGAVRFEVGDTEINSV
jgi:hypothetical protein